MSALILPSAPSVTKNDIDQVVMRRSVQSHQEVAVIVGGAVTGGSYLKVGKAAWNAAPISNELKSEIIGVTMDILINFSDPSGSAFDFKLDGPKDRPVRLPVERILPFPSGKR